MEDGRERVRLRERAVEAVVAQGACALDASSDERGAAWRGDGRRGVVGRERDAALGEPGEARRAEAREDVRLRERLESDVAEAQVVGEDEDDVGAGARYRGERRKRKQKGFLCNRSPSLPIDLPMGAIRLHL